MKYIFIILIALPSFTFSQRIKVSEYDKFIKQQRIETSLIPLKLGLTSGISVSFKSIGDNYYALLSGHGTGASTIGTDDQAIFLLEGDSTVTIKSMNIQSYDANLDKNKNKYNHEYRISLSGLETLSRHKVKSIRKYGFKDYVNLNVSSKNGDALKKLSGLFLNELLKHKIVYTPTIRLEDVASHVGDSVIVCGKIYSTRYLINIDNKPTLFNLGASYPKQVLTMVIYESDRKNFNDNPETFYRDKDVCITGKIELYNSRPQIVVRNKDQVQTKD